MARRLRRVPSEEDNFLVSSADLMACVLFVFILLALVFAVKAWEAETVAKANNATLVATIRKWGDTSAARRNILEQLQNALNKEGITVFINQDNDGLRFPEGALTFDQCSNQLRISDKKNLSILAQVLGPIVKGFSQACGPAGGQVAPPEQQIDVILIEGHTDRRAPASGCGYSDNWTLSTARASTTRALLLEANADLGNFCNSQSRPLFAIAGYADQRPSSPSAKDDDNRRIELRFIMRPPVESPSVR